VECDSNAKCVGLIEMQAIPEFIVGGEYEHVGPCNSKSWPAIDRKPWMMYLPNSTWKCHIVIFIATKIDLNKMIVPYLSIYNQIVSRYQSFARLTPSVMRRVL